LYLSDAEGGKAIGLQPVTYQRLTAPRKPIPRPPLLNPGVCRHPFVTEHPGRPAAPVSLQQVNATHAPVALWHRAAEYGPFILSRKFNRGKCPICEGRTLFVETGEWLRDQYLCVRCGSIPRWRALIVTLDAEFPDWRDLAIHESSPFGPASQKLRREAGRYTGSQYLLPEVPRGAASGAVTCQDLEALTFPDQSFDLLVTQDVLEHVLRPELAVQEIARVLRPGGAHVFTVPTYEGRSTVVRATPSVSGIEYLLPAEYHGNPVDPNGSLVVRDWGEDLVEFISEHSGLPTEAHAYHDRSRGLDGWSLVVFVTRKPFATS
jgi:hypothetical protein